MASRGSAIDRVLAFYRTASHDQVRVVHMLAQEAMRERGIIGGHDKALVGKGVRKARKPRQPATAAVGSTAPSGASGG